MTQNMTVILHHSNGTFGAEYRLWSMGAANTLKTNSLTVNKELADVY